MIRIRLWVPLIYHLFGVRCDTWIFSLVWWYYYYWHRRRHYHSPLLGSLGLICFSPFLLADFVKLRKLEMMMRQKTYETQVLLQFSTSSMARNGAPFRMQRANVEGSVPRAEMSTVVKFGCFFPESLICQRAFCQRNVVYSTSQTYFCSHLI